MVADTAFREAHVRRALKALELAEPPQLQAVDPPSGRKRGTYPERYLNLQIVFARSQAPLRFGRSRHCDTTPEKPGIRVAQVTGRSPRRPDFEHAGRAGFSPISLFTRRAARAPPRRTRLAA